MRPRDREREEPRGVRETLHVADATGRRCRTCRRAIVGAEAPAWRPGSLIVLPNGDERAAWLTDFEGRRLRCYPAR